jgi:nicotinamide-nucleotide amidase
LRGEIVSVGTELLLGHITDTNAAWLAQELSKLGIDCFYVSQLGDNLGRLTEHLRLAWSRSDLIVMSGGVGPTEDDLTREAIAGLLGEEMHVVPALEADLRKFFERRGVVMPERNVKQATLIPSARTLANPVGTAPGWFVERDGKIIVAMPGVPGEMFRMWEHEAVPLLRTLAGQSVILTRTYKVIGIGESAVEELLRPLLASENPTIATYAKNDGVHVRTSAKSSAVDGAEALLNGMEPDVRSVLGHAIYGTDSETLAGVTIALLAARGQTIAVGEEFTGGLISSELQEGGHDQFAGGVVSAADPELVGLDDVMSGAQSRALELARRVVTEFGADYGLGQAADVAPRPNTSPGRHSHTVLVDATGHELARSRRLDTTAPRIIRMRAVLNALNVLREHLIATEG